MNADHLKILSAIDGRLGKMVEDKSVKEKCGSLCIREFSKNYNSFLDELEAFLSSQQDAYLSSEMLINFEASILKSRKNQLRNSTPAAKTANVSHAHIVSPYDAASQTLGKRSHEATTAGPSIPRAPIKKEKISTSVLKPQQAEHTDLPPLPLGVISGVYAKRTNAGQTVTSFNPTSLSTRPPFEPSSRPPLGMRCSVEVVEDEIFENIDQRYRFMFTTLEERARAMEMHLLSLQEKMCTLASIPANTLQPVGIPSQDYVWVCGRICCETAEGKINRLSVVLEGSKRDSAGRRVKLDLKDMQHFSLFPGQVVLVEGINASGRVIVARRIIEGVPLPHARTSPSKLLEYHHSPKYQGGSPLSVLVAAGPFTTADNLSYQPFEDLLRIALKSKPDLLILVGPFVDISHPQLSSGQVTLLDRDEEDAVVGSHEASYELVFVEKIVRDGLKQFFNTNNSAPTNIVLVPSLLDAHHEFVFPQPPFGDREKITTQYFEEELGVLDIPYSTEGSKKRVHLMPNPCMFRMNEVVFGVSSNDVLFALSSDETSVTPEGTNRLARMAGHVLEQQSFAPQLPVPSHTLSQYDLRHSKHWELKGLSPDVLVMPSKLAPMAKEVLGTLVLNPGSLSKGNGGGTFAECSIHPIKEDELRDAAVQGAVSDNLTPHSICRRSCVNILRI